MYLLVVLVERYWQRAFALLRNSFCTKKSIRSFDWLPKIAVAVDGQTLRGKYPNPELLDTVVRLRCKLQQESSMSFQRSSN